MSDYRHDILGPNGLSTASGTFTMKSPLMGSGGGDTPDISPLVFGCYINPASGDPLEPLIFQHLNDEAGTAFDCKVLVYGPAGPTNQLDTATVLDFFSNESNKTIGRIGGRDCILTGKFGAFSQFENGFECDYFQYISNVYRCAFHINVTVSQENDGTFTAYFVHQ